MKRPEPGYYWAMIEDDRYPTVVLFSDEGGDQWFEIMNVDHAINLNEADGVVKLLARIPDPPTDHK